MFFVDFKFINKFYTSYLYYRWYTVCLLLILNIKPSVLHEHDAEIGSSNLYKIIWQTNFIFPHLNSTVKITCPESECISSSNQKLPITDEDFVAYIFYGSNFDGEVLPLPRKSNHFWCLLHEESPMNNFIFSHSVGIQLFNFTATFSRHSDFPLTTQFLPDVDYLMKRKPVPVSIKNQRRKEGFAPVLYLQSHCNVASDRDRYVKELMKFIDIDSYGACLHNKDLPTNLNSTLHYDSDKLFTFIAEYKFHIAFENALCDDYITEKFFRPLHVGSIPIYRGSPSIKDWMPSPTSVILADDFESPAHLAKFLIALDQNDELYNNYLTYKNSINNDVLLNALKARTWHVNDPNKPNFISGFECFVCDNLIKITSGHPKNDISKIATRKHMNCHQPHLSLGMDINVPLSDKWIKEGWIDSYWFAYDQAKAVQKMIQSNENSSSVFWKYMMKLKYEH